MLLLTCTLIATPLLWSSLAFHRQDHDDVASLTARTLDLPLRRGGQMEDSAGRCRWQGRPRKPQHRTLRSQHGIVGSEAFPRSPLWAFAPQPADKAGKVLSSCLHTVVLSISYVERRVDHDCRAGYEANMYATRYVTPPNPVPAERFS